MAWHGSLNEIIGDDHVGCMRVNLVSRVFPLPAPGATGRGKKWDLGNEATCEWGTRRPDVVLWRTMHAKRSSYQAFSLTDTNKAQQSYLKRKFSRRHHFQSFKHWTVSLKESDGLNHLTQIPCPQSSFTSRWHKTHLNFTLRYNKTAEIILQTFSILADCSRKVLAKGMFSWSLLPENLRISCIKIKMSRTAKQSSKQSQV